MLNVRTTKFLLAALVMLFCTSVVRAADPVSPLTATPTSVTLTYQKPSTAGPAVDVSVSATNSTYFTVDAASVPIWLTVGAMSGTAVSTGVNVSFTPNSISASLGAGTFNGTVKLKVTGFQDKSVAVKLVISNPAPTLTVSEGNTQTINWTQGSAYPSATLTMLSSNEPINFTAVPTITSPTTPEGWLKVNKTSGVAYNWGTPIVVSLLQAALDGASVGDALTGKVTVTPAGGSAIDVNFTINVQAQAAVLTRLVPSETPTQAGALSTDPPVLVVVMGSGFVASPSNKKTVVKIGSTTLATGNVNVLSSTTMLLSIPADNAATAATLVIGVQNPAVGTEQTANLKVTSNPIVNAVTDSASLVQASPGTSPNVAPYEIVSLFGDNFGPATSEVVYADTDSFGRYPNSLTAQTKTMTVAFLESDNTPIANAYLLFATKNQINAMVPSGVAGKPTVKIVVTYDGNAGTAFVANVVTASPGVYTATSSGTGQGAILHAADYSANSTTNKAAKNSTVLLYLTGMGAPNSTAPNTATTSAAAFPASCMSLAAYMGTINTLETPPGTLWTNVDGAVILADKIKAGRFAPCFTTAIPVKVTIGGVIAKVNYAGWIADGLAGVYQVNAVVPTSVTSGDALPVVVTVGTAATSQSGVTMAVQ